MTTQVAKWGNSLALRIPRSVAAAMDVRDGDAVTVTVERGAIVIRPTAPRYSLAELVGRITVRNRHSETDWGGSVGGESW